MSAPRGGWKLGRDSFSKMICWFKDGQCRTMYSIDWRHKYSKQRDRGLGLQRFRIKVQRYGMKADTIEIYDAQSRDLIEKYYEGIERPIPQKESQGR